MLVHFFPVKEKNFNLFTKRKALFLEKKQNKTKQFLKEKDVAVYRLVKPKKKMEKKCGWKKIYVTSAE